MLMYKIIAKIIDEKSRKVIGYRLVDLKLHNFHDISIKDTHKHASFKHIINAKYNKRTKGLAGIGLI